MLASQPITYHIPEFLGRCDQLGRLVTRHVRNRLVGHFQDSRPPHPEIRNPYFTLRTSAFDIQPSRERMDGGNKPMNADGFASDLDVHGLRRFIHPFKQSLEVFQIQLLRPRAHTLRGQSDERGTVLAQSLAEQCAYSVLGRASHFS